MSFFPPTPPMVSTGNSTSTPLVSLAVTGASLSGSSLTLTGAWAGGGSNAYVGFVFWVTGFTGAATGNNSSGAVGFTCTASAAGSITVTNAGGYNGFTGAPVAAQMFIGTGIDVTTLQVGAINVESYSDQASLANGFQIQMSTDNSNWDRFSRATANAGSSTIATAPARARYMRIVYINGSTTQGVFRLQTLITITAPTSSIRNLNTVLSGMEDAQTVRAIISGKTTLGSTYQDVKTDTSGNLQIGFGSGSSSDAFGRARVGTPVTLFNSIFRYNAQPLLWDTVATGGGTATKTTNVSSVTLNTGGTTNGDGVYFQSHLYLRYEPGKSQLAMFTGLIGAKKSNVRSRYGYYDTNDGCYFEMDGTNGAAVNVRTSTSGSPVDAPILQANWNLDKMDGTGNSGITIDFSKTQVFIIDLQWLGTGRVRFGFLIDGVLTYCHQINNANVLLLPYMNTAQLPVRAEIFNTGTAASGTTMSLVCCTVISEGGEEAPNALQFTANNGTSTTSVTTRRSILTIRPKTTFNSIPNHIPIQPINATLKSNSDALYEIVYGGTLGGSPSFSDVDSTNSGVEKDVAGTTVTGGVVLTSGYVPTGNTTVTLPITTELLCTISAAGVQDNLSLVVTSISGTAVVQGSLTWEERR